MIPTPKANAMLICDQVITDKSTGKKSLIGVFENISAAVFPCIHHLLSVYVKLTEAHGTYRFALELIDLKRNVAIARGEIPHDIVTDNPRSVHELVFNLRNLKFLDPGDYEFRIFANGKIFGQKTFLVQQLSAQGPAAG